MERRTFLKGLAAAMAAPLAVPALRGAPAIAAPPAAKQVAILGTNCGGGGQTWKSNFTQFPQLTRARVYNPQQALAARAGGASFIYLSMSGRKYFPDGTAAKIKQIVAWADAYATQAKMRAGDGFTLIHEYERPPKDLKRFEPGGYGWSTAIVAIKNNFATTHPGVIVGATPTGSGVASGRCDPFWKGIAGKLEAFNTDLYSGIDAPPAAGKVPFKDRAQEVVPRIHEEMGKGIHMDFPEINTTDTSLSPDWFAAAAYDICEITGVQSTIYLFQDHASFPRQNMTLYPPALKRAAAA